MINRTAVSELARLQRDMSLALNDPAKESPDAIVGRDEQGLSRRFNIYRNNRAGSLVDALHSTYPALHRLLGEAFFRAAARQFIDEAPPSGPVLSEYGEGFGRFVQTLPGTSNYPYLFDVARLEWQRLQSFHARNETVLDADALQAIEPAELVHHKLTAHSASALVRSDWAIGSLWQQTQSDSEHPFELNDPQSVLVTRPELEVNLRVLSAEGALFFQQLIAGATIAEAATQCLIDHPAFDTGTHLQGLITTGAFTHISHT